MTDTPILDASVASAPKSYVVAGAQEIILKGVTASFNGTGAAGSYVPAVQIIDPAGNVIGTYTLGSTLAAGASADVSWFPGVGLGGSSSAGGITLLDYVEITAAVTVTGGVGAQTVILTGNPLVLDGSTRIRVEVGTPQFDLTQPGNLLVDVWEDSTDLGRIMDLDIAIGATLSDLGIGGSVSRFYTPAAGTHTYTVRGWTTTGAPFPFFQGGPGLVTAGNPNYMPGWMAVWAVST